MKMTLLIKCECGKEEIIPLQTPEADIHLAESIDSSGAFITKQTHPEGMTVTCQICDRKQSVLY